MTLMLMDKSYYDYDYVYYKQKFDFDNLKPMDEAEIADLVSMFVGDDTTDDAEELQRIAMEDKKDGR